MSLRFVRLAPLCGLLTWHVHLGDRALQTSLRHHPVCLRQQSAGRGGVAAGLDPRPSSSRRGRSLRQGSLARKNASPSQTLFKFSYQRRPCLGECELDSWRRWSRLAACNGWDLAEKKKKGRCLAFPSHCFQQLLQRQRRSNHARKGTGGVNSWFSEPRGFRKLHHCVGSHHFRCR